MPSRHVCQVKYRKVGLEQGEGDTCYHMVPMQLEGRHSMGDYAKVPHQPPQ